MDTMDYHEMVLFRHKTKHNRFMILVPLWTVLWIAAVVLLGWFGWFG